VRSVELFAGAGGLAMGVSAAGFSHDAVVERDSDTCTTIRRNQERGMRPLVTWPLIQHDVATFDFGQITPDVDLIAGGPPCQPFSLGGKHGGYDDKRDMFPQAVRAVRELRPSAFMFENVKGLLRESFSRYFEYVILQLTYPDIIRARDETDWIDHLSRLERYHTSGGDRGLSYRVVFRLLNAADYGVPQRRERVFIVGFRDDLELDWSFPNRTHSQDELLRDKWVTGKYWDRHEIARRDRPEPAKRICERIRCMLGSLFPPQYQPWLTVRDAICDLPQPGAKLPWGELQNHEINPGARSYPGHTGSPLDEPAKTLKAGDHGVPGGENTIVLDDESVRYLTVRESARLQCFPDDYVFPVSWTESMRQLGNAVPVTLAHAVAQSIHGRLHLARRPA